MGDRVATARPPELDAKLKRMKEKREREERAKLEEQTAKKRSKGGVFLDALGPCDCWAWGSVVVFCPIRSDFLCDSRQAATF
jgi:hypothetical protein